MQFVCCCVWWYLSEMYSDSINVCIRNDVLLKWTKMKVSNLFDVCEHIRISWDVFTCSHATNTNWTNTTWHSNGRNINDITNDFVTTHCSVFVHQRKWSFVSREIVSHYKIKAEILLTVMIFRNVFRFLCSSLSLSLPSTFFTSTNSIRRSFSWTLTFPFSQSQSIRWFRCCGSHWLNALIHGSSSKINVRATKEWCLYVCFIFFVFVLLVLFWSLVWECALLVDGNKTLDLLQLNLYQDDLT